MINISVVGRLVANPETYQGGTPVTRFRVAVDRRFKRDGDPEADFFNVIAFGNTAEFVDKYFEKGQRIAVTGRMQNDNYTDKDGNTFYRDVIVAENVEFCDSKKTDEESGKSNKSESSKSGWKKNRK